MKILVDARSLGKKPSGIGIYIYNFVKEIANYENVTISLLTDVVESEEMNSLSNHENIDIHAYGKSIDKTIGLYGYYKFVQKIIHEVKPDIFWEGNNLVPIKIKNPYGKFVVTIHDMFPLNMPDCFGKIYPIYFRYGIRKTIRQVDTIIYNSQETKNETEKYFPKASEIPGFISYIIVDCNKCEAVSDKGYFLYVGNLEKRKGTDILLKSFHEYRKRGGKKKLCFAGKFREAEIEELYQNLQKQTDGLEYMGYVNAKRKEQLLADCSCFLFPSRAEGFGIPVVEALIYGKRVLASRLSIFEEIVGDHVKYVACEEENAVEKWATCMLETDGTNIEIEYQNPYEPEILGKKLFQFFCRK